MTETAEQLSKKSKILHLATILLGVVGILSITPVTITVFAYGLGYSGYIFSFAYLFLITSIFLIIAKTQLGYYLALIVSFTYIYQVIEEVEHFLIFERTNYPLAGILLFPYLVFLALILLCVIYLTTHLKYKRFYISTSLVVIMGIVLYPLVDGFNKNYYDNVFIMAEFTDQSIELNVKPGFADSRSFTIVTSDKDIGKQIKEYGEYHQGSYLLMNVGIRKNFRYSTLRSITLYKFGDEKVVSKSKWSVTEMKGDLEFLVP
ncbi:hypothetical protein [Parapedobacter sp. 2B3]|uniref:hypothetical protein n=1 Tax=Parapedobacter sp. 2B3 TaxID=3342381 RepID=UPI0035B5B53D